MSIHSATVSLAWQGGRHDFCIAQYANVLALEAKCAAGVATIRARLMAGAWYIDDVRETLRLGLIGGGMPPADATKMMELHVDPQPKLAAALAAIAVLNAYVVGVPEDNDVGKGETERAASGATDASSAPSSTASAPPSASPQEKSIS